MTQIASAKPFAAATEPPSIAGMGHNTPPLDQMIVMQLKDALDEKPGFRTRVADILAKGADPADCEDDDRAGRYGDFCKMAKAAQDFIDGERTRIKAPYLEATRALDGTAKAMSDQIGDARARVKAKLDKFVAEQAAKARAEAARIAEEQAELRRQQEARETEARRVAEAERQRLQAIEDAKAEAERARLQAIEDEKAAAAGRAAAAVVVDVVKVEVAPEPTPEPAYNPLGIGSAPPVFRGDLGSRVGVKQEWKHKIESVRQLPDALLKHPKVIEALDGVIKAQIRGGAREIKGCKIWPEDVSSVR